MAKIKVACFFLGHGVYCCRRRRLWHNYYKVLYYYYSYYYNWAVYAVTSHLLLFLRFSDKRLTVSVCDVSLLPRTVSK